MRRSDSELEGEAAEIMDGLERASERDLWERVREYP